MEDNLDLISTEKLNSEIEKMFKEEKYFIFILSPYLDISENIQSILTTSKARIIILYREIKKKSRMRKIEDYKKSMPKIEFFCLQNFHAKAYITSNTFIITSLNLYEYSQLHNFELGVLFKGLSYNKMIEVLIKELKNLFEKNGLNPTILDNLKLQTVDELFNEILKKNGKKEKDYPDKELLRKFSKQMLEKFDFDKESRWRDDENMLQRWAEISGEMCKWGIENIKL